MSYNSNIPLGTDAMIKSQGQIRSNFQSIYSVFAENHVNLNDDLQGMHVLLNFRAQTIDPTTSATQIAIYTKLVSTIPMLFYAPSSSQTPIQLTYPSISTGLQSTNPNVYLTNQYSFVAGPFIIYGGVILTATDGQVVNLTPTSTLIYASLQGTLSALTPLAKQGAIGVISGSSFTIRIPQGGEYRYFAIGKP